MARIGKICQTKPSAQTISTPPLSLLQQEDPRVLTYKDGTGDILQENKCGPTRAHIREAHHDSALNTPTRYLSITHSRTSFVPPISGCSSTAASHPSSLRLRFSRKPARRIQNLIGSARLACAQVGSSSRQAGPSQHPRLRAPSRLIDRKSTGDGGT